MKPIARAVSAAGLTAEAHIMGGTDEPRSFLVSVILNVTGRNFALRSVCHNTDLRTNPGHGQSRRLPTAVGLSGEQSQLQTPGRRRQTCARTEQHARLHLDAAADPIHRAGLAPGGPWATTGYRS